MPGIFAGFDLTLEQTILMWLWIAAYFFLLFSPGIILIALALSRKRRSKALGSQRVAWHKTWQCMLIAGILYIVVVPIAIKAPGVYRSYKYLNDFSSDILVLSADSGFEVTRYEGFPSEVVVEYKNDAGIVLTSYQTDNQQEGYLFCVHRGDCREQIGIYQNEPVYRDIREATFKYQGGYYSLKDQSEGAQVEDFSQILSHIETEDSHLLPSLRSAFKLF